MATSGTIGQTVISTAKVIEHAVRRCGLPASSQTPETVYVAKDCLFLLLMHYANTSLNLWCVDTHYVGLQPGQKEYTLPTGTNNVLNAQQSTPTLAPQQSLSTTTQVLTATSTLVRVGLKFSTLPTTDFTISTSTDGVSYTTRVSCKVLDLAGVNAVYWFDLDPVVSAKHVQVSSGTLSAVYSATGVSDLPVTPWNRDTYAAIPNKNSQGGTITNYLFNKLMAPSITLWQVPSDETRHLSLLLHRQVQDVGSLTQSLAIPTRWFESTIIQLAFRLSMELPGVDPTRIKMLSDLASKFNIEAMSEETDSAPIEIEPGISPYTR